MQAVNNSILLEIYQNCLINFQKNGWHPHPANLLAMLLLTEKENYKSLKVCEGVFYETYKNEINAKIEKVMGDFNISHEEIKMFIEMQNIMTDDESFESDKIWFVFADGFGIMHGEMMYRPNQTDYQMYSCMDNKSKLYKMTADGLEEIIEGSDGKRQKNGKCEKGLLLEKVIKKG